MRVISKQPIRAFWERHPESKTALEEWFRNASRLAVQSFPELRRTFGSADYVDGYTIFDVGGNKAISKNECTQIAQDFLFIFNDCKDAGGRVTQEQLPRRKNRRIASYVTIFTTQKMDKKTSELGIFFAGNRLSTGLPQ